MAKIPTVQSQEGIGSVAGGGAGSADVSVNVPSTGSVSYSPLDAVPLVSGDAYPAFTQEAAASVKGAVSTIMQAVEERNKYQEEMWVLKATADIEKQFADQYAAEGKNPETGSLSRFQPELDRALKAVDETAPSNESRLKATSKVTGLGVQYYQDYLSMDAQKGITQNNNDLSGLVQGSQDIIFSKGGDPETLYMQQARNEQAIQAAEAAHMIGAKDAAYHREQNAQLTVSTAEYLIAVQGRVPEGKAVISSAKNIDIKDRTRILEMADRTIRQQADRAQRGLQDSMTARAEQIEMFGKSSIPFNQESISKFDPKAAEEYGRKMRDASITFLIKSELKGRSTEEMSKILTKYEPKGEQGAADWNSQVEIYGKAVKYAQDQAKTIQQAPVTYAATADPTTAEAFKRFTESGVSKAPIQEQAKLWIDYAQKTRYAQERLGVPASEVKFLPEEAAAKTALHMNELKGQELVNELGRMQQVYGADDFGVVIRQMSSLPEGKRLNQGVGLLGEVHLNKTWITAAFEAQKVTDDTYRTAIGSSSMDQIRKAVLDNREVQSYAQTLMKSKEQSSAVAMQSELVETINKYAYSLKVGGMDSGSAATLAAQQVVGEEFGFRSNSSDASPVLFRKTYYTDNGAGLKRTDNELDAMQHGMEVLVGSRQPYKKENPILQNIALSSGRATTPNPSYTSDGQTFSEQAPKSVKITGEDIADEEFNTGIEGFEEPSADGSLWTKEQKQGYAEGLLETQAFWAPTPTGVVLMRPSSDGLSAVKIRRKGGGYFEYTQRQLMAVGTASEL